MIRSMLIVWLCTLSAHAGVRPAGERVDAIVGHPLVIAVVGDDPGDFQRPVEARMDDGRRLGAWLYRLSPALPALGGWIGPVPRWSALPREEVDPQRTPPGVWYLVVALPVDAVGQGLWLDGVRHDVNWLPDPERAALEAGGRALWQSPVPDAARGSEELRRALDAIAGDPFQRWRSRLVRDGIAPAGEPERTGPEGTDLDRVRANLDATSGDRFLNELARSHEARWQLILGRLALISEETASRMRRALAGVALLEGRWVPMWAPASAELGALQSDLLSPFVDDETRELRARAWLDVQPKAAAWVIDDAGEGFDEGASRLTPTVGVLSLPARPGGLLVEVPGPIGGPELITAPPYESIRVLASVPMVERRGRSTLVRTNHVPVRVGRRELGVDPVATVVGATPPGVVISGLQSAWTMPALRSGSLGLGALPAGSSIAGGLVRRIAPPDAPGDATGWSVYLACMGEDLIEDAVTVWVGPYGLPRAVWRIEPTGAVRTLFGPSPERVLVVPILGGWALDARLPASVIGPDGVLRLGIDRVTDAGRSSWPRRSLPWQDEPGRLPIDTRTWSGL